MSRRIPKEIKQEILAKAKAGEKVKDLAEQYGISDRTIYGWLSRDSGSQIISVFKYNRLRRENAELKRLIGELTLNMSVGKKN
ncbi:MAG: transposase [Candidatus Pacebacteria bacterium]|nr:transposase [Candidatus Paceibacterota bacterium]